MRGAEELRSFLVRNITSLSTASPERVPSRTGWPDPYVVFMESARFPRGKARRQPGRRRWTCNLGARPLVMWGGMHAASKVSEKVGFVISPGD